MVTIRNRDLRDLGGLVKIKFWHDSSNSDKSLLSSLLSSSTSCVARLDIPLEELKAKHGDVVDAWYPLSPSNTKGGSNTSLKGASASNVNAVGHMRLQMQLFELDNVRSCTIFIFVLICPRRATELFSLTTTSTLMHSWTPPSVRSSFSAQTRWPRRISWRNLASVTESAQSTVV